MSSSDFPSLYKITRQDYKINTSSFYQFCIHLYEGHWFFSDYCCVLPSYHYQYHYYYYHHYYYHYYYYLYISQQRLILYKCHIFIETFRGLASLSLGYKMLNFLKTTIKGYDTLEHPPTVWPVSSVSLAFIVEFSWTFSQLFSVFLPLDFTSESTFFTLFLICRCDLNSQPRSFTFKEAFNF